jgi:hypothetical protein
MKAVFKNRQYVVVSDEGEGVILESVHSGEREFVKYSADSLILDPTDDEWVNCWQEYSDDSR